MWDLTQAQCLSLKMASPEAMNILILVRGRLKKRINKKLKITLGIADSNGYMQKVRVIFKSTIQPKISKQVVPIEVPCEIADPLEKEIISTNAAGNQIILTMNGNLTITGLAIDDNLMSPSQKEKLINGIKDAHSDALKKMQRTLALKMREMGGLPNIPGFN